MFIPKTVIQAFRKFANAFLDRPIRKLASDIGIHATANGCTLQVSDAGKSISCAVARKADDEPLVESVGIPSDLFEQLAKSTGDIEFGPVESTENGSRFIVRWQTGLAIRHEELDSREPPAILGDSIPLTNIDNRFLPCLANAFEVADEISKRYALGCVQLDGRDGTMAATDGSHMVRFDGFEFPWKSTAVPCFETGNSGLVTLVGLLNFGNTRSTRLLASATGKPAIFGCGIGVPFSYAEIVAQVATVNAKTKLLILWLMTVRQIIIDLRDVLLGERRDEKYRRLVDLDLSLGLRWLLQTIGVESSYFGVFNFSCDFRNTLPSWGCSRTTPTPGA